MEKPKILGIKTIDYPKGRIDEFRISELEGNWVSISDCLKEFGFDEDIDSKIDATLEERGYIFLYLNSKLRVHLSAEKSSDFFILRLDTSLPREEVIKTFEKYFRFPN